MREKRGSQKHLFNKSLWNTFSEAQIGRQQESLEQPCCEFHEMSAAILSIDDRLKLYPHFTNLEIKVLPKTMQQFLVRWGILNSQKHFD